MPVRPRGPLLHALTPTTSSDAPPRSLSAKHGLGAFPLHTDAAHHRIPPRWMLLRCAQPGAEPRPTVLVDSRALGWQDRERREFERIVWRIRNGRGSFLASAVLRDGVGLRYDADCMAAAAPSFGAAAVHFGEKLKDAARTSIRWEPGLALLVDNWRVLHGRAVGTGDDAGIRRLDRVLVSEGER